MSGLPGNASGKRGGARAGAGAKPGQKRVHVAELRDAIESRIGMPYQEILAVTYQKLFNNFQNDLFVREYLTFNENINKRLLEDQSHTVNISDVSELTREQIQDRINNLLARKAMSEATPTNVSDTAAAASHTDHTSNTES
jgi:hypothetical protein